MDNYIKTLYLIHFLGQCNDLDCEFCKWEREEVEKSEERLEKVKENAM